MNRALKIISNILAVSAFAALIFGYSWLSEPPASNYAGYLLYVPLVLFVGVFSPFFHELGHALFGLFSGLHAKLSIHSFLPHYGATEVQLIPRRQDRLKPRLIVTLSGGLAVNFVFLAVGLLAFAVPQIPVWVSAFAAGVAPLFIRNVFPVEYASGKTDMLVICELIKNSPEAEVTLAVIGVQAKLLAGKPIEEVERSELFDLPVIREDDQAFIALTELRAKYLLAMGDAEGASAQIDRLEQLKKDYIDQLIL